MRAIKRALPPTTHESRQNYLARTAQGNVRVDRADISAHRHTLKQNSADPQAVGRRTDVAKCALLPSGAESACGAECRIFGRRCGFLAIAAFHLYWKISLVWCLPVQLWLKWSLGRNGRG